MMAELLVIEVKELIMYEESINFGELILSLLIWYTVLLGVFICESKQGFTYSFGVSCHNRIICLFRKGNDGCVLCI